MGTAPYLLAPYLFLSLFFLLPGTAPRKGRKSPVEKPLHLFDEIFLAAGTANFRGLDDAGGSLPVLVLPEVLPPVLHSFSQETAAREKLILYARDMTFRTAPGVILWGMDDAGPHWIHLHISDRRIKMPLIQDAGKKPALPEVTGRIPLAVEILGI